MKVSPNCEKSDASAEEAVGENLPLFKNRINIAVNPSFFEMEFLCLVRW